MSAPSDAGGFVGWCGESRGHFPAGRDRDADSGSPGETSQCWVSPMGFDGAISVDEKMGDSDGNFPREFLDSGKNRHLYLGILLVAGAVYLGCILSPPSLMDDVAAVQAQIARNMLTSGDWVTARLAGVPYLEKAPLIYWLIAICYQIFGVHDWVARMPVALASIGLAWLTAAMGKWAIGEKA